ncbi:MAG TPA: hypothetical protein DEP00_02470 [Lachnospiraceae bacterium]|jgi:hypothetical protein|nr:hypothetical protein [Lachnospiraceae bacterium]
METRNGDVYYEQMVKRGTKKQDTTRRILIVISGIIICFLPFLLGASAVYIVEPVLLMVVALMVWIMWRRAAKEYEYIYTDGTLDIDVIYGKASRRHLVSFDLRKVELIAPALDPQVHAAIEKDKTSKKLLAIPDQPDQDTYVILGTYMKDMYVVYFQPEEELKRYIRRYAPRKAKIVLKTDSEKA